MSAARRSESARTSASSAPSTLPTPARNIHNVGSASFRVGTYFGVIGAIDTSDAREKSNIRGYTAAEIGVARRLAPKVSLWQLNDSIREKGVEAARVHIGWVFQDVVAAFVAEGLDPFRYGCVGFDELDKVEEYMETVPRKKMRLVPDVESAIEVVDGRPVLVQRGIERDEPVGQEHPVLNPDGSPVMVNKGRRTADGTPILEPLTHFVHEMEDVEEPRSRIVPDIDDNGERRVRGNVRPTQLLAFVLGGMVVDLGDLSARVTALEAP
ncbi:tail fiber domain-containing protein [Reyranella massiliensis]|uniref:tail fiber domain-containing protein n=1 Tax=Reyranella massiliensis TaxID=445220 RepID=UPI00031EF172|nr:tail fiber domain-containing protein [Reyranella massiliensis]